MRILVTTSTFQETPGRHHELLAQSGHEIIRAKGSPLSADKMTQLVTADGGIDGLIHGDDFITREVIAAALPRLKALSKYGIGLDSVDVAAATELKVPVLFTPGVNHTTVAEHTFGLIICLIKQLVPQISAVKQGKWKRMTGNELAGKTLGVLGMGRIGKEVAKRGIAFDMRVLGYDLFWDEGFAQRFDVTRCGSAEELLTQCDVAALHMNLTAENRHIINADRIATMKDGAIIVNCARGGLVDEPAVAAACRSGKLRGYGTDVLEHEPVQADHPFLSLENVLITPHVGSRTFESVERQAVMATENLLRVLRGEKPLAQANEF